MVPGCSVVSGPLLLSGCMSLGSLTKGISTVVVAVLENCQAGVQTREEVVAPPSVYSREINQLWTLPRHLPDPQPAQSSQRTAPQGAWVLT